jgi:hypothetical protein
MSLIAWLANKLRPASGKTSADNGKKPGLTVRLELHSHEVTDEEFSTIKAERRRKGKEWAALGWDEQQRRMIEKFRATAETNRKRAISADITHYIWLWPGTPECDIGMRNNGKTFSYLDPPPEGHPCEGECHAKDWCRCMAKSVVRGFA